MGDRLRIYFIRHFKTPGNLKRKYIGCRMDEGICEEALPSKEQIEKIREKIKSAKRLYISPMLRCRQTADLLLPALEANVCDKLRETDFGTFEGKTYEELKDEKAYQEWLDSGGRTPCPNGESNPQFLMRTKEGFWECISQLRSDMVSEAAFVVHGGTIMSLLSQFSKEKSAFYDWQVPNGAGFQAVAVLEGDELWLEQIERID